MPLQSCSWQKLQLNFSIFLIMPFYSCPNLPVTTDQHTHSCLHRYHIKHMAIIQKYIICRAWQTIKGTLWCRAFHNSEWFNCQTYKLPAVYFRLCTHCAAVLHRKILLYQIRLCPVRQSWLRDSDWNYQWCNLLHLIRLNLISLTKTNSKTKIMS